MKTKDYIFIGLATVISLVIYFFSIMVSSIGGAFGHSISPGFLDYYLESYLFILAITTLEKEFLLFTQLFYCYFLR